MDKLPRDFRTADLGEAAALRVEGLSLSRILWEGRTAYFVFTDPGFEDLSRRYQRDQLSVPALRYYRALRQLKTELFSQKGGDTHEYHDQA